MLAQEPRTGCSTGRLVEGLWPDALPERPGKAVQILVSRLRGQLGADLVVNTPTGYRLALDETRIDSSALLLHEAASAERARAGDHAGSLAEAEAGLALWDGSMDSGTGEDLGDPVVALRTARVPAHSALFRSLALALARLGRREEAAVTSGMPGTRQAMRSARSAVPPLMPARGSRRLPSPGICGVSRLSASWPASSRY